MNAGAAHTVALIRARRALRIARPRRRLPRQLPPSAIEREYVKAVGAIVTRAREAFAPVLAELPSLLSSVRRELRMDVGEARRARDLVSNAAAKMRSAIHPTRLEDLARSFAKRTTDYQRRQLGKQAVAALGVDPFIADRGLAVVVENFLHENVALITNVPAKLMSDLEPMVARAVSSGTRHEDLARDIADRFDMADDRAERIARDQIGKLYGQVNATRQQELGITRFVWRTVGDEAVRGTPGGKYPDADPSHYALDGKTFDFDDPPDADVDGGPALPGEAINCRCSAEPVFADILDAADEED